jgi:polycomb protein EED
MNRNDHDIQTFAQPKIREILKTDKSAYQGQGNVCWSTKFWRYDPPETSPIFCLSNRWDMMVCRIREGDEGTSVEVIRQFEVIQTDEDAVLLKGDPEDQYCSCAWAYITPNEPLLLGAGDAGFIRVFDVVKGDLKTTLVGHGAGVINELATHPKYPWIFASASRDQSIRIWDLRRWNNKLQSATVMILGAGHGHCESILSIGWHDSGRYLVSGGFDNRVCVWTLPDLAPESAFWDEIAPENVKRRAETIRTIYYPHFVSAAIHKMWVDCVQFYGDIVISKAADEHTIVLWTITGFDSHLEPPDPILAPKVEEHLDTRNGFMREQVSDDRGVHKTIVKPVYRKSLKYQRLLQLSSPNNDLFFCRFALLKPSVNNPDIHACIGIANMRSTALFWDLDALECGYDYNTASSGRHGGPRKRGGRRGGGYVAGALSGRGGSRSRLNQLAFEQRSESIPTSASASLSVDGYGTHSQPRTSAASSPGLGSQTSSPPLRSTSTDATSLMSDPLPLGGNAAGLGTTNASSSFESLEPSEDRVRFPLHNMHKLLSRAHHTVHLRDFFELDFVARGVAYSPDGRWCVIAGETYETIAGPKGAAGRSAKGKADLAKIQIGGAVVLERELPRVVTQDE